MAQQPEDHQRPPSRWRPWLTAARRWSFFLVVVQERLLCCGIHKLTGVARALQIYTFEAKHNVFALNWANRPEHAHWLAVGSFVEDYTKCVALRGVACETTVCAGCERAVCNVTARPATRQCVLLSRRGGTVAFAQPRLSGMRLLRLTQVALAVL